MRSMKNTAHKKNENVDAKNYKTSNNLRMIRKRLLL